MTQHEADDTHKPGPEVEATPARRRRHSPKYKRQVLDKLESMTPAERGAYLRKEGLYSSMVSRWKQKLDGDQPTAPAARSGGNVDRSTDVRQLKRQLEQAERRLKKAEAVIDLQKKPCRCSICWRRTGEANTPADRAHRACNSAAAGRL